MVSAGRGARLVISPVIPELAMRVLMKGVWVLISVAALRRESLDDMSQTMGIIMPDG